MLEELYCFADLDFPHKKAAQLGIMTCVKTDFRTPQGLFSSIIYHCILKVFWFPDHVDLNFLFCGSFVMQNTSSLGQPE